MESMWRLKMTNLNEIKGLNAYCGPGVLAALTGKSTDECAAVISSVTGAKVIKGARIPDLLEAAKRLGFDATEIKSLAMTVYGQIGQVVYEDGFYIIGVPQHVVAIEVKDKAVYLIDNHTKIAIQANNSARLSQKVTSCHRLRGKTKQELADEARRNRIAYLEQAIANLTTQIEVRTNQRTNLRLELVSLCSQDQKQST